MFRSGAAPGRITYADGKPGVYLPPEEKRQFRIEVDPVNNRLIDIPGQGIDTICDPVIVEDLKMILSPDDYRIFREQLRLPEKSAPRHSLSTDTNKAVGNRDRQAYTPYWVKGMGWQSRITLLPLP